MCMKDKIKYDDVLKHYLSHCCWSLIRIRWAILKITCLFPNPSWIGQFSVRKVVRKVSLRCWSDLPLNWSVLVTSYSVIPFWILELLVFIWNPIHTSSDGTLFKNINPNLIFISSSLANRARSYLTLAVWSWNSQTSWHLIIINCSTKRPLNLWLTTQETIVFKRSAFPSVWGNLELPFWIDMINFQLILNSLCWSTIYFI